ncbi:hypothetical protein Cni_G06356 [Canna indica]|uniref:DUF4283 domain-containing protein n=1 Tax=Canna indica TaxID=4628 RepID=A0AAQ3JYD3_9LILI|nr:hypothetical protein Cni_G06356 [Canna indica]
MADSRALPVSSSAPPLPHLPPDPPDRGPPSIPKSHLVLYSTLPPPPPMVKDRVMSHPASQRARTSWAEILREPQSSVSKVSITPPIGSIAESCTDIVHFSPSQLRSWNELWEHSLIGKFFGRVPPLSTISAWAKRIWLVSGFDSILDLEEVFFVFQFSDPLSSKEILIGGPYALGGSILCLVPWRPGFRPWCENFSTAPVWVRLLGLPLEYWNFDSISALGQALGKMISIDDRSFQFSRGRYVRVCVGMNLRHHIRQGLWVGESGKEFFQPFAYENLPSVCFSYGVIGHREADCPNNRVVDPNIPEVSSDAHHKNKTSNSSMPVVSSMNVVSDQVPDLNLNDASCSISCSDSSATIPGPACGPWILVSRRNNCRRSSTGDRQPNQMNPIPARGRPQSCGRHVQGVDSDLVMGELSPNDASLEPAGRESRKGKSSESQGNDRNSARPSSSDASVKVSLAEMSSRGISDSMPIQARTVLHTPQEFRLPAVPSVWVPKSTQSRLVGAKGLKKVELQMKY